MPPFCALVVLAFCGPRWAVGELVGASWFWLAMSKRVRFPVTWAVQHLGAAFALLAFMMASLLFPLVALGLRSRHWAGWESLAAVVLGTVVTAVVWPAQRRFYALVMAREESTTPHVAEDDATG
ncbi:hypothetical protein ABIA33_001401 [Streptacidiphilus sp. MAP12-16]|uniref:hypothetical protein n=1 Tax=Streptacidiphilus sp. MAP12-16 TaxID=3156300 RepID=UPI0035122E8B